MFIRKKKKRTFDKGFTLVEILGVVIVLSLLLSIIIFSVDVVLSKSKEKISKVERNNILEAAKDYVIEFRGSDNWIEEKKDNGDINFCVSLDSLIDYGYFEGNNDNYEKYRNQYVVKSSIVNGVYSYDFVKIDDLPDGDLCK